eukprot:Rhum_TRINITY_DN2030_c0_g1::Rhum_TRINITY_DN2030_c0_g1_i1::g.5571::m.5571/K12737/SDCCAG10; peptidyl-prolyl cis-trans isomerase SDCCAG10
MNDHVPHPEGLVTLKTSLGSIDIELWPNEAPKACRNFVQHCVDQYYEGCKFHRVVKDFLVQTGDPTDTGDGGRSIYEGGKAFDTETNLRLKFKTRGMVAMAGEDGDNRSQFFITLNETRSLDDKYTIFGRVLAKTIYPVLSISQLPCKGERPVEPPVIVSTVVRENPFDDVFARDITREKPSGAAEEEVWEERRRGKKRAAKDGEPKAKKRKAVKNTKMLSMGDELEEEEEKVRGGEVSVVARKSMVLSVHDLHDDDAALSKHSVYTEEKMREVRKEAEELARKATSGTDAKTEKHKRRMRGEHVEDEPSAVPEPVDMPDFIPPLPPMPPPSALRAAREAKKAEATAEKTAGRKYLEQMRARYARSKGTNIAREKESVLKLESWKSKLRKEKRTDGTATEEDVQAAALPATTKAEDYEAAESKDWFKHKLNFVNPDAQLATGNLVDENYDVQDPLAAGQAEDTSDRAQAKRQRAEDLRQQQLRKAAQK